jgi:hypothetical protein
MKLDIMRCNGCGRLAVAIEETRITNYKCAGSWKILSSQECDLRTLREIVHEADKKVCNP